MVHYDKGQEIQSSLYVLRRDTQFRIHITKNVLVKADGVMECVVQLVQQKKATAPIIGHYHFWYWYRRNSWSGDLRLRELIFNAYCFSNHQGVKQFWWVRENQISTFRPEKLRIEASENLLMRENLVRSNSSVGYSISSLLLVGH